MAAEALENTNDERVARQAREVIERQVSGMARLIDDLMDVSRISRGKIELRKQHLDLRSVLQEAVEVIRPLIDAAGQSLSMTLPTSPITVYGDRLRLTQVFTNLLNNAAKYSEAGGEIALVAKCAEDIGTVEVRDRGHGIEPDLLESIWDMFVQADRSPEAGYGGLGVGLTLVRSLIDLHEGTVVATSGGSGTGATFTVGLPLRSGAPQEDPTPRPEDADSAIGLRVLVADDNRDAADALRLYLEMAGCEVATAYDGQTALELAAEWPPTVALLDLGMPGMGGLELARRIRGEAWGSEVTLVAITGWGQESDRQRSQEAGFDHHLVKPVRPAVLRTLIEQVQEQA
jgi:CheY-like chemotaxis protein/two-component sensor histidine kinase